MLFPPIDNNSLNNGKGKPKRQTNQNGISFFSLKVSFLHKDRIPIATIEIINKYNKNQNCPKENPPSAPVKSVNFVKKIL